MNWALKAVENFGRQRCGIERACRHSLSQRYGSLKAEADSCLASGSGVEEQYFDRPLPTPAQTLHDCSVAHGCSELASTL